MQIKYGSELLPLSFNNITNLLLVWDSINIFPCFLVVFFFTFLFNFVFIYFIWYFLYLFFLKALLYRHVTECEIYLLAYIKRFGNLYFAVENLTTAGVNSYKDIDNKIQDGTRNRTVAATNMNATSRYCQHF